MSDGNTEEITEAQGALQCLVLREVRAASNEMNAIMMRIIANYISDEELSEYGRLDAEDQASLLDQLHLILQSNIDEFTEYFRGYYGTPDNNFHQELLDEEVLDVTQDQFFAMLDWDEIYRLCRMHYSKEWLVDYFFRLTGHEYLSERQKYPHRPWDGKPCWPMENGRYLASE